MKFKVLLISILCASCFFGCTAEEKENDDNIEQVEILEEV